MQCSFYFINIVIIILDIFAQKPVEYSYEDEDADADDDPSLNNGLYAVVQWLRGNSMGHMQ